MMFSQLLYIQVLFLLILILEPIFMLFNLQSFSIKIIIENYFEYFSQFDNITIDDFLLKVIIEFISTTVLC